MGNSEIGSERGRSFRNSPDAASMLSSDSESSEISKIRSLLSTWWLCEGGTPEAWEKSQGSVFPDTFDCLLPGLVGLCDPPFFLSAGGPLVDLVPLGFPLWRFCLKPFKICFWTFPFLEVGALYFLHNALRAHCILSRAFTSSRCLEAGRNSCASWCWHVAS